MNGMRVWASAGALAVGVLGGWVAAPGAQAAGCASMTLDYAVPSGSGIVFVPRQVSIAYGGCVVFTNKTATTARITVSGGYRASVAGFGGSAAYPGRAAGWHGVTATSGPATATGSIAVGASGSAATPHRSTAHRGHTQAASATPLPPNTPSARAAAGPKAVAALPKRARSPVLPRATSTPVSSPAPTPEVAPSSSAAAVVSGPLEPPSGRGIGLPAALAALAVVGTGAALVRVLLAETTMPVDDRTPVGGTV